MRRDSSYHGVSSERFATLFPAAIGYCTLGRRWKSFVGRINLVVKHRQLFVSIEIKARSQQAIAKAVLPRQLSRIIATPNARLAAHPEHARYDMCIDAVPIAPGRMPQHVLSAFEVET
jgi:putative endonuclease